MLTILGSRPLRIVTPTIRPMVHLWTLLDRIRRTVGGTIEPPGSTSLLYGIFKTHSLHRRLAVAHLWTVAQGCSCGEARILR
jgi:hypothetical protein